MGGGGGVYQWRGKRSEESVVAHIHTHTAWLTLVPFIPTVAPNRMDFPRRFLFLVRGRPPRAGWY